MEIPVQSDVDNLVQWLFSRFTEIAENIFCFIFSILT